jgi:hypothetical protein
MTNQRRSRTRYQRKREAIKAAAMAAALIILGGVLTVWALGIWSEHPGEQPVSGVQYIASLQNGGDSEW